MKYATLLVCASALIVCAYSLREPAAEPTPVRLPRAVADSLGLVSAAVPSRTPVEVEESVAALPIQEERLEPRAPHDARPADSGAPADESLTEALATRLREQGMEVEVPAMVLYSGPRLDDAMAAFQSGVERLVDQHVGQAVKKG